MDFTCVAKMLAKDIWQFFGMPLMSEFKRSCSLWIFLTVSKSSKLSDGNALSVSGTYKMAKNIRRKT